jgi:hypothetical protein
VNVIAAGRLHDDWSGLLTSGGDGVMDDVLSYGRGRTDLTKKDCSGVMDQLTRNILDT